MPVVRERTGNVPLPSKVAEEANKHLHRAIRMIERYQRPRLSMRSLRRAKQVLSTQLLFSAQVNYPVEPDVIQDEFGPIVERLTNTLRDILSTFHDAYHVSKSTGEFVIGSSDIAQIEDVILQVEDRLIDRFTGYDKGVYDFVTSEEDDN